MLDNHLLETLFAELLSSHINLCRILGHSFLAQIDESLGFELKRHLG